MNSVRFVLMFGALLREKFPFVFAGAAVLLAAYVCGGTSWWPAEPTPSKITSSAPNGYELPSPDKLFGPEGQATAKTKNQDGVDLAREQMLAQFSADNERFASEDAIRQARNDALDARWEADEARRQAEDAKRAADEIRDRLARDRDKARQDQLLRDQGALVDGFVHDDEVRERARRDTIDEMRQRDAIWSH